MKSLIKYLGPDKKSAVLGLAAKFIETILELFLPMLMADMIDSSILSLNVPAIFHNALLMVVIIIANIILAILGQYFASRASTSFGKALRGSLFQHINKLSYSGIDTIGTSSLITRITSDSSAVQNAVFMTIRIGLRAPFVAIGAVIMAFVIDPIMASVFIGIIVLISIVVIFIMKKSAPIYSIARKKLDRITSVSRENISGARVVRANVRRAAETKRLTDASGEYMQSSLLAAKISSLMHPLSILIIQSGVLGVLIVSGFTGNAKTSPASLTALVTYMMQILFAIMILTNLAGIFVRANASASRINEVFDLKPGHMPTNPITEFPSASDLVDAVKFDNVAFSYGGKNVFSNVTFSLQRGEHIGILGGTGSGKTTLVNLIPSFYAPTSGMVSVFGFDTLSVDPVLLRSIVAIAPQKALLITGTVRDNVAFGRNIADSELMRALSTAQADFVLSHDDGLDRVIERDGVNISGGQRQRISIARALAGNPQILIFDDAGSALDYATEASLAAAIASNYPNMTILTVSQRIFAVRRANKILVLDDGKMVGLGTHEELIEQSETYRSIYMSQIPTEDDEL
ncbi:MAG: ABC transporter ATP-binding protein/permease [Christensenellaceae bacterium]|nr:ABC transporter ATP-binding protein/permease [Christensenellaceae bacterium]